MTRTNRWAKNPDQRGGKNIRFDAHFEQSDDGAGSVVGMQGGEHKMTRQARLDRDGSRFRITDFGDHDDIRVVPQDRAETFGKGESRLRMNLALSRSVDLVFDRVFQGNDVLGRILDFLKDRHQGCRLPATGRTGNQEYPFVLPKRRRKSPKTDTESPRSSSEMRILRWSSRRTIDSPQIPGKLDTLKSISISLTTMENLPSCGIIR